MIASRLLRWACGFALLAGAGSSLAHGPGHQQHRPGAQTSSQRGEARLELRDLQLVDRRGRPTRFRSDAVGDRIVAIDFVYTSCTTVCPVISEIFAQVQSRLGERLGDEVSLISISVDPATDVPRRLNAYAERFSAQAGWTWLTGDKGRIDQVLRGLGAYSADVRNHAPFVLVGDAREGRWTRLYDMPGPEEIVAKIDELARARR